MKRKLKKTNEVFYLLGMVLCALGVALSAKSGFGVSMVVAPAYVLHCFFAQTASWFTFGVAEYFLQGTVLLVTALICRRVKWKYLGCVFGVLLYGILVDFWRGIVGTDVPEEIGGRLLLAALGAVIVAFAIAMLLRTYLPQQAYELCVQEITERYALPLSRVKWTYDISSLVVSVVLMLLLFRRFDVSMIGPATLVLTVINAPMISLFGKLLDSVSDFSSAFPRFYRFYEEKLG